MRFWSGIWLVEKRHNEDASCLEEVRDRMFNEEKKKKVEISVEVVEGCELESPMSRRCKWVLV